MKTLKNILFPIDFSDCSRKSFSYALDMAKKFDASLHLLFVAQDLSYLSMEDTATQQWLDMTNQIALSGEAQMEDFCAKNLEGFEQYKTKVAIGDPKAEILRYARDASIDIIVMGTHGRTGTDRILMGSVADWVVKHASIPVLTLNPFKTQIKYVHA